MIILGLVLFVFYLFAINIGGRQPSNSNLPPRWRNG